MHASSMENMQRCIDRYLTPLVTAGGGHLTVLDVGGADVNGSYRSLFQHERFHYLASDLEPSRGVDVVMRDPYHLPFDDGSIDVVLSGQMFEHCEFFWQSFVEMVRVLKEDGVLILIAPSAGPIHRYPVDCYRFYPDAYRALARHANCHLLDVWQDERGPWRDLVGVFSRRQVTPPAGSSAEVAPPAAADYEAGTEEEEAVKGGASYLDVLARIHQNLVPELYLEIGVRRGRSLALAECDAIGIDPAPMVEGALGDRARVVVSTSDEFFREVGTTGLAGRAPDLVFIDGMHLFEFALRDFMNAERVSGPGTVVVIDDVFPNHPRQATRQRQTNVWTGDVWKLHDCLARHRPDLFLMPIDAHPTGLLLVAGLDSANRVLWDQYNPIVAHYRGLPAELPPAVLVREGAVDAAHAAIAEAARAIRAVRGDGRRGAVASELCARVARRSRLALSVVIVARDMRRELPRTVRSLSPALQRGIDRTHYELVIVDNGSSAPMTAEEAAEWGATVSVHRMPNPTPSPAAAINLGLAKARGEVVGVWIDGARLASPGILAGALEAARLHPRPVIGTLGFHLGHDVQMRSVLAGYDQAREDALLDRCAWTEDPYRLFEISVPGASSARGWFEAIAESNGLFMRSEHWREVGGFDAAFQSPGGGLVNLDCWKRACESEGARVFVLLGEGTFHQVHGGVATNAMLDRWPEFHDEYVRLRGVPFARAEVRPTYLGRVHPAVLPSLEWSAHHSRLSAASSDPAWPLALKDRGFMSHLPAASLDQIQQGVLQTRYRGIPMLKSPFDIALYLQLIGRLLPRTIIEIGTKHGGSAIWFADMQTSHGIDQASVLSIDIEPTTDIIDSRITFLQGDARELGAVLAPSRMRALPHPLMVVEDSAHGYRECTAVLTFFDEWLSAGDYIVVEDGVVSQLSDPRYLRYQDGPNLAVIDFLNRRADDYEVDVELCDHFGRNATYNPNGWLRRR